MARDFEGLCGELDNVLVRSLDQWKEDLENPEGPADGQSLYCLYPQLVAQIAWARGTLSAVNSTMTAIQKRYEADPGELDAAGPNSAAAAACCCPCCGSHSPSVLTSAAHAPNAGCTCREGSSRNGDRHSSRDSDREEDPKSASRDGEDEVTETRIYEETIIEETSNGRGKEASKPRRRRR